MPIKKLFNQNFPSEREIGLRMTCFHQHFSLKNLLATAGKLINRIKTERSRGKKVLVVHFYAALIKSFKVL